MKNTFIIFFFILAFFLGCSAKHNEELYNLSASQWYAQIIKDLQDKDLEKADNHYSGMSSEHVNDPLLETTLIILAQAHMDEEEYKLAEFYLDEYAKKFGSSKNVDFIRYLKIRAKFEAFAVPNRNQALMLQSQKEIDDFLKEYPQTQYEPLVQTMLTKFNLAVFHLNSTIADLYQRTGREESYQIYQKELENSEFFEKSIIKPELPWYRSIFEKF